MTKRSQIWKCEVCGNIVEILHEGADALVCCGKSMVLQKENKVDAAVEKHKPVIEGRVVKVGSVAHPMTEEHYIEWIEATGRDGEVVKKILSPGDDPKGPKAGDEPEAEFCFEVVRARAYCNLHGLWS